MTRDLHNTDSPWNFTAKTADLMCSTSSRCLSQAGIRAWRPLGPLELARPVHYAQEQAPAALGALLLA